MTIEPQKSMFIRLRGTNLPANVPFETDWQGSPLADSLANDNIYSGEISEGKGLDSDVLEGYLFDWVQNVDTNSKLDEVAEAYADLWFYSNPIYIEVVDKHGHGKK